MSVLGRFRLSPRWLVLLLACVALAVTTAALAPHDESADRNCLVCKAGHEPLQEHAAELVLTPPASPSTRTPDVQSYALAIAVVHLCPPRAPPA